MEMVWKGKNRKGKCYTFGDHTGATDGVLLRAAAKWPPWTPKGNPAWKDFWPFISAPKMLVKWWDSAQSPHPCAAVTLLLAAGIMYEWLWRATWKSSHVGSVNKWFITWLNFLPVFSTHISDQTSKRLLQHSKEKALTGHPVWWEYIPQIFRHIHLLTENKIFQRRRWNPKSLPFFTMKI